MSKRQLCEWPGYGNGGSRTCRLPAGHPGVEHWFGRCDKTPGCRWFMFHAKTCWTGPA